MSDTTWIPRVLEPHLRLWLGTQFPGHSFSARLVTLSGGGRHTFDAVSEDGTIIANFLSNRAKTVSGKENTGGRNKALNDITTLRNASAKEKIMVFTDAQFMQLISRRATSKGGYAGIRFMHCALPPEIAAELARVLDAAREEQV